MPLSAQPGRTSGEQGVAVRDIELRAVFGTREIFTRRRVAEMTAGLPGVDACIIVGSGWVEQAPQGPEAEGLARRADALLSRVRGLAGAIGVPDAEAFTLRTEEGVISVFTQGNYCLAVRHSDKGFDPGEREKLILISRGIAGLQE